MPFSALPRLRLILLCVLFLAGCANGGSNTQSSDRSSIKIGGGTIGVHVDGARDRISGGDLDRWIDTAAQAVTQYFGRFPVKHVDLRITLGGEDKVSEGVTYGGRRITIRIGRDAQAADLQRDWRLTHEMFHLAFPDLD